MEAKSWQISRLIIGIADGGGGGGRDDLSQSLVLNFSSISPKLCLLGQKNIGTLIVNATILTPGLWL